MSDRGSVSRPAAHRGRGRGGRGGNSGPGRGDQHTGGGRGGGSGPARPTPTSDPSRQEAATERSASTTEWSSAAIFTFFTFFAYPSFFLLKPVLLKMELRNWLEICLDCRIVLNLQQRAA